MIVGAGHNGLVAAFYQARAGLEVAVLEARDLIGGACVSEEFHPGFVVSTASYSLSLLRPDVYSDMRLADRGLVLYPKDPELFAPFPDGTSLLIWRDKDRSKEEIARISSKDAEAYTRWNSFWEEAVTTLRPFVDSEDPPTLHELEALLARQGKQEIFELAVAS
ncbi:MAG: phytoene desaturase family protein, partial [Acidimicrobiia bacterium]